MVRTKRKRRAKPVSAKNPRNAARRRDRNNNNDNDGHNDNDADTLNDPTLVMRRERRRLFRQMIRERADEEHFRTSVFDRRQWLRYAWTVTAAGLAVALNRDWAYIVANEQAHKVLWSPLLDMGLVYFAVRLSIFICSVPLKLRFQHPIAKAYARRSVETVGRVVECEHATVTTTYKVVVVYPTTLPNSTAIDDDSNVEDLQGNNLHNQYDKYNTDENTLLQGYDEQPDENDSITTTNSSSNYCAKVFFLKDLVEYNRSEEFPLLVIPGLGTSAISKRQYITHLVWWSWPYCCSSSKPSRSFFSCRQASQWLGAIAVLLTMYVWIEKRWKVARNHVWTTSHLVLFGLAHVGVCSLLAYWNMVDENRMLLHGGGRSVPVEWIPWMVAHEMQSITTMAAVEDVVVVDDNSSHDSENNVELVPLSGHDEGPELVNGNVPGAPSLSQPPNLLEKPIMEENDEQDIEKQTRLVEQEEDQNNVDLVSNNLPTERNTSATQSLEERIKVEEMVDRQGLLLEEEDDDMDADDDDDSVNDTVTTTWNLPLGFDDSVATTTEENRSLLYATSLEIMDDEDSVPSSADDEEHIAMNMEKHEESLVAVASSSSLWDRLGEDYRQWLQASKGISKEGFETLNLADRLMMRKNYYDTARLWHKLDDDYRAWLRSHHGISKDRFRSLSLPERLNLRKTYYESVSARLWDKLDKDYQRWLLSKQKVSSKQFCGMSLADRLALRNRYYDASPEDRLWDNLDHEYREWLRSKHKISQKIFCGLSLARRLQLRTNFYDSPPLSPTTLTSSNAKRGKRRDDDDDDDDDDKNDIDKKSSQIVSELRSKKSKKDRKASKRQPRQTKTKRDNTSSATDHSLT